MAPAPVKPSGSRRGVVQRFTGKVGPLPVWAWALLILVLGYLAYRLTSSSSSASSTDTAPADTTAAVTGDTGSPPASGMGGSADNLNGEILTQLTGIAGGVDGLTALLQSSPAFGDSSGDSGSGSTTPNDGSAGAAASTPPATTPTATPAPPKPSATAPATVRYFTYAPGKAPKGRAADAAPAKGPAGTTLHFARGKGYYYA